jgi:hypothetical protein
MEMKLLISKWIVRIIGVLIAFQSIGFFAAMIKNINMYFEGWSGALLKGIVMGVIGLVIFLAGAYLVKYTFKKIETEKSEEEKLTQEAE